ncbi:hypothetical protein L596_029137 [Steinernema carpocapsae]|uniref:Uncharacterized protein n=1 Tax=Steinernema carpocapsae TaxID=34508 RepID=A0A4V5ZXE1_STECR|nr:hypothetical protein L596_029137 [Steinernema carpocapsae]
MFTSIPRRTPDRKTLLKRGNELLRKYGSDLTQDLKDYIEDSAYFAKIHDKCGASNKILSFLPPEIVYDSLNQRETTYGDEERMEYVYVPRTDLKELDGTFGYFAKQPAKAVWVSYNQEVNVMHTNYSNVDLTGLHQIQGLAIIDVRLSFNRTPESIRPLQLALKGWYQHLFLLVKESFIEVVEELFMNTPEYIPCERVRFENINDKTPSVIKYMRRFLTQNRADTQIGLWKKNASDLRVKVELEDCAFTGDLFKTAIETFKQDKIYHLKWDNEQDQIDEKTLISVINWLRQTSTHDDYECWFNYGSHEIVENAMEACGAENVFKRFSSDGGVESKYKLYATRRSQDYLITVLCDGEIMLSFEKVEDDFDGFGTFFDSFEIST